MHFGLRFCVRCKVDNCKNAQVHLKVNSHAGAARLLAPFYTQYGPDLGSGTYLDVESAGLTRTSERCSRQHGER